jgi:ribosome biogenesis GTPase
VIGAPPERPASLVSLGWSDFFDHQCEPEEKDLVPARIAGVHRTRLGALSETGPIELVLAPRANTADYAIGDWVLVEARTRLLIRRLERRTLLQRRTEGSRQPQLVAANVDTLFIVTS